MAHSQEKTAGKGGKRSKDAIKRRKAKGRARSRAKKESDPCASPTSKKHRAAAKKKRGNPQGARGAAFAAKLAAAQAAQAK